jgi:hypothetical protein
VLGAAHGSGGVGRHDLTDDKPIKQMPQRREPLLDARRGAARPHLAFDPRGNMQRRDMRDGGHAGGLAPRQKLCDGAAVGAARVRVADVGGEEFEKARACPVAGGGDQDGNGEGGG